MSSYCPHIVLILSSYRPHIVLILSRTVHPPGRYPCTYMAVVLVAARALCTPPGRYPCTYMAVVLVAVRALCTPGALFLHLYGCRSCRRARTVHAYVHARVYYRED